MHRRGALLHLLIWKLKILVSAVRFRPQRMFIKLKQYDRWLSLGDFLPVTGAESVSLKGIAAVLLGFCAAIMIIWDTVELTANRVSSLWLMATFAIPALYAVNTVFPALNIALGFPPSPFPR